MNFCVCKWLLSNFIRTKFYFLFLAFSSEDFYEALSIRFRRILYSRHPPANRIILFAFQISKVTNTLGIVRLMTFLRFFVY